MCRCACCLAKWDLMSLTKKKSLFDKNVLVFWKTDIYVKIPRWGDYHKSKLCLDQNLFPFLQSRYMHSTFWSEYIVLFRYLYISLHNGRICQYFLKLLVTEIFLKIFYICYCMKWILKTYCRCVYWASWRVNSKGLHGTGLWTILSGQSGLECFTLLASFFTTLTKELTFMFCFFITSMLIL